jgi:uncharacterized protein YndB with AHSA1/START domain
MTETTRMFNCTPQAVFDVLTDGWTYATWVVGAARIRAVDADFPAVGAQIHHSVGAWPLLISDRTEIEECEPPRLLQLRVAAWPAGAGRVRIVCDEEGDKTRVTMFEESISGPAKLIPQPLEAIALRLRNKETLKRLAYIAESGARSKNGPREPTRAD